MRGCALLLEVTVVAGHVPFEALLHLRALGFPECRHCLGGIQPIEEHIAGEVVALFQGRLVRPEKLGALAIDRDHFIGQQAQVVLGIGVPHTHPQTTLVKGANMRHAITGTPDIRRRLRHLLPCRYGQAQPQQQPCHAHSGQPVGNNHADSTVKLNTLTRDGYPTVRTQIDRNNLAAQGCISSALER